jgi:hypothetical protein
MHLGPLWLLAAEVYERSTAPGIYCNLHTGQERRQIPFATHGSATIELASLSDDYDVVVIDEIQMITDRERGYAWTKALMGTRFARRFTSAAVSKQRRSSVGLHEPAEMTSKCEGTSASLS